MSPHFNLFPGKTDFEFSVPKTKGTIQTFISDRSKSKRLSWYGVQQSKPHGWLAYVQRYIDMEAYTGIVQRYTAIKMMSFMLSPWLLYQDNARSHSACATTAWFCRQSECVRLASRSVSYWKCMTSHEKENQTMMITDCWASEVLYQARLGKHFTCNTLKISILYSQTMKHCK